MKKEGAEVNLTKDELANIYESYIWKTVSILQKVLTGLITEGSVHRKIVVFF